MWTISVVVDFFSLFELNLENLFQFWFLLYLFFMIFLVLFVLVVFLVYLVVFVEIQRCFLFVFYKRFTNFKELSLKFQMLDSLRIFLCIWISANLGSKNCVLIIFGEVVWMVVTYCNFRFSISSSFIVFSAFSNLSSRLRKDISYSRIDNVSEALFHCFFSNSAIVIIKCYLIFFDCIKKNFDYFLFPSESKIFEIFFVKCFQTYSISIGNVEFFLSCYVVCGLH